MLAPVGESLRPVAAVTRALAAIAVVLAVGAGTFLGIRLSESANRPEATSPKAPIVERPRPHPTLRGTKVRGPRRGRFFWGAYRAGAPYRSGLVASLGREVGRRPAILMWYQEWAGRPGFPARNAAWLARRGIVPMVTWEPWRPPAVVGRLVVRQPRYRLSRIAAGAFDGYLRAYARAIRRYGGPVMLRPFHEMDGFWYPWGGRVNGNTPQQFIAAWRHMHRVFDREGAHNVTWVWSVNHRSVPATRANSPAGYWPGGRYVDWIGISGFNWGLTGPYGGWLSFEQVYRARIRALLRYHRPIALTELGTSELGGNKALWIRGAFRTIARRYRSVRAVIWYDHRDTRTRDWRIDSSRTAEVAFKRAVSRPWVVSAPAALRASTRRS